MDEGLNVDLVNRSLDSVYDIGFNEGYRAALAEGQKPSHNSHVMPCRMHRAGFLCVNGLYAYCEDFPCKLSAARA